MRKIIILFCIFLFLSCRKESSGKYTSYFNNQSKYEIELVCFKSGKIDQFGTKRILPNQNTELYVSAGSDGLIAYDIHIAAYDSIIFNLKDVNIVHYSYILKGDNMKALQYNHPRNIFNKINWSEKVIVNEKHKSVREYTYNFSEQDYLDLTK